MYVLSPFFDLVGAFNNVKISSIDQGIINCTLRGRVIISSYWQFEEGGDYCQVTTQGGVISPILWNLVVNEIPFKFVFALIKWKFLSTISEVKESSRGTILECAKENSPGVNPSGIKLVLFSRSYKVSSFKLSRINDITLELFKGAE